MREILFRGKCKDSNEWVYGGYTKPDYPAKDYAIIWESWEGGAGFGTHVIPETVGQFTGLLDKNDVKIFEGDIVKTDLDFEPDERVGLVGKIVFHSCKFSFEFPLWKNSNPSPLDAFHNTEIIGNIHDNPELLEVKP